MALPASTASALRKAGVPFAEAVPLHTLSWWRTGGPADAWVTADDVETLASVQRAASQTGCPVFVLGNGSNLLISDAGIRGIVVQLAGQLAGSLGDNGSPPVLTVGAGLKLTVLVSRAGRYGWTGLECFAGIPGTIGGAVAMNAGTRLGEAVDTLIDVDIVSFQGEIQRLTAAQLQMSYRTCKLPDKAIVCAARLRTTGTDPATSRRQVKEHLEYRAQTQPLDFPSCGSTFRNPPGEHAGRLIEAAGLKGWSCGPARVSEKHANFILNPGGATAADIRHLIEHAQHTVAENSGIRLQPEVHYAGDWSGWESRITADSCDNSVHQPAPERPNRLGGT